MRLRRVAEARGSLGGVAGAAGRGRHICASAMIRLTKAVKAKYFVNQEVLLMPEGIVPGAATGGCIALGAMADEGAALEAAAGERIARGAMADGITVATAMVAWTALGAVDCVAVVVAAASGRIWAMTDCTLAVTDCTGVANCVAPAATADGCSDASVSVMSAEADEAASKVGWRVLLADAADCEAMAVDTTVADEGAGALAVSPLSMCVEVVSDMLMSAVSV